MSRSYRGYPELHDHIAEGGAYSPVAIQQRMERAVESQKADARQVGGEARFFIKAPGLPAEEVHRETLTQEQTAEFIKVAAGNRSKYHREITKPAIVDGREVMVTVSIDAYDVLHAWRVTNPALAHLIKKALQPGARGHKTIAQDMQDIIDSAVRAKELEG